MTTKSISTIAGAVLAAGIVFGAAGAANAAPSIGNLNPAATAAKSDATPARHRWRRGGRHKWRGRSYRRCRPTYRWVRYYGTWIKRYAGTRCFPRYRPHRPYYPYYPRY